MFYSWSRADQEAWGIDSLAQDVNWAQFTLPYCFPPFPLLQQVLDKCRRQEVHRMVLVAPWWTGEPFFPALLDMLLECRRIRVQSNLVMDLPSNSPPPDLRRLKLVACLISGKSGEKASTSTRLRRSLLRPHGEPQPKAATTEHGASGSTGAPAIEYKQLCLL